MLSEDEGLQSLETVQLDGEADFLVNKDQPSCSTARESVLSFNLMSSEQKEVRTQGSMAAQTNLNKMFIGIALVAFPFSVSWVGFVAAALGVFILAFISLCSSYMLFKARNRFKSQTIVDFADLGYACYGEKMRLFCQVILMVAQLSFLTAYMIYLGEQASLVACYFGHCKMKVGLCSFVCVLIMMPAWL